jgi:hypothetical protein
MDSDWRNLRKNRGGPLGGSTCRRNSWIKRVSLDLTGPPAQDHLRSKRPASLQEAVGSSGIICACAALPWSTESTRADCSGSPTERVARPERTRQKNDPPKPGALGASSGATEWLWASVC